VGGGAVEEATVSAHVGAVRVKPSGGRRGRCCTGERVLGRGPRPAIKGGGGNLQRVCCAQGQFVRTGGEPEGAGGGETEQHSLRGSTGGLPSKQA
jgi:hypothetical protein